MPTIRDLRLNAQLSQEALAAAAGVGSQTVWRAEAGQAIRKAQAQAICLALGVKLDQVQGLNVFAALGRNRKEA